MSENSSYVAGTGLLLVQTSTGDLFLPVYN